MTDELKRFICAMLVTDAYRAHYEASGVAAPGRRFMWRALWGRPAV